MGYLDPKQAIHENGELGTKGTSSTAHNTHDEDITSDILNEWAKNTAMRGAHPCRKIIFKLKSHDQGWGGDRARAGSFAGSYTWFDVGLEEIEKIESVYADCKPQSGLGDFTMLDKTKNHKTEDHGNASESERIRCFLRTLQPPVRTVYPQGDTSTPNASEPIQALPTDEPILLKPANELLEHPMLPSNTRLQSNRTAHRTSQEHVVTWAYDDAIFSESAEGDDLERNGRGRASMDGNFVRSLKVGDIVTVWARARFHGWRNNVEEVAIEMYWAV